MKLDNNVLNLLINKETIRFIAQPNKDGFSKAVTVSPINHLYSNFEPCNCIPSNNVILGGVNKDYKTIMTYPRVSQYGAL